MPPLRDCAARAAARAARAAFPGRAPQRGSAHLQVARVGRRTEIVRLSHCAPVRLLPMATAAAERSGTAWCALGSFGGGFLGGDEVHVAIEVGPGSSLALTTQASTKVYQAKEDGQAAVQRLDATIAPAGLLVMAPDPLVPFAHSSYSQALRFALHANSDGECTSSAVVVDWLGSGRVATGERWAFREYKSCLEFAWLQEDPMPGEPPVPGAPAAPGLIDSIFLTSEDALANSSPSIAGFDAAVSIFAVGPQAAPVAARLEAMASLLAARSGARVAEAARGTEGRCPVELSGRALMGLTPSSAPARSGCTVARLVAEKTEDVYRILHHCLSPLAEEIGVEPYADRVHGLSMTPTERSPLRSLESPRPSGRSQAMEAMEAPTKRVVAGVEGTKFDLQQSLILCQLTDATLPVGGFAHSNGIEAAHQLGLLRSGDLESLRSLVFQGALSMLRLQGYFVKEAHQLGAQKTLDAWQELDVKLNAYLASNGVASRASWLQGAGLLRVGKQWQPSVAWPRKGHYATSFGLLSRRLDLDLTLGLHAFAYAAVRDSMSAAVRLNLLGPLQAVELQASILQDLPIELGEGQTSPHGSHVLPASCAPVLECVHSGHDLLEARLFLT